MGPSTTPRLCAIWPKIFPRSICTSSSTGAARNPGSAPDLLLELEDALNHIGAGRIVDGVGRGIVLDRDENYAKVKRGYDAMVLGRGRAYR